MTERVMDEIGRRNRDAQNLRPGTLGQDVPQCGPHGMIPEANQACREKTAQEVIQDTIDRLELRANQLKVLRDSLPAVLPHHANKALCALLFNHKLGAMNGADFAF
jgi:hypothetical protein